MVKRKGSPLPRVAGGGNTSKQDAKFDAMQKQLDMLKKENAELKRKVEGGGTSESGSWVQSAKTKKKKKQEPEGVGPVPGTAAPAQKPKEDALLADGWSVPILADAESVKGDVPGVFLASEKRVRECMSELRHVKVALAALCPKQMSDKDVKMNVPVTDMNGRFTSRPRFLVQFGPAPVTYDVQMQMIVPRNKTSVIVMRCAKKWAGDIKWGAATANPIPAAKGWLKQRADIVAIDCFHPTTFVTHGGLHVMQIMARIPEEHLATALRHSGGDGVFCREIFTSDADKEKHKIVWLDPDCSLEAALRQSKRVEGSVGLIANDRGLGVRVVKEQHKFAVATLQGDAAAQVLDHSLFEASGVPVWWTQDTLEECLMEWGWEAKGVSRGYVKNGRRVWILKAKDSPSGAYMQTDEGLVTVQCAKKLPPRGPVATNRWRRGSGPVAEVSWSQVWTEKPTKPAVAAAPVFAPSATASPSAAMTVQAPSQATFVPGTPQAANTAAPGTPVGASAAPAPVDIAALIAQALAPHMSVVTSLEQHLVSLLDRVGHLENAGGEGLAEAKRRRREEELELDR